MSLINENFINHMWNECENWLLLYIVTTSKVHHLLFFKWNSQISKNYIATCVKFILSYYFYVLKIEKKMDLGFTTTKNERFRSSMGFCACCCTTCVIMWRIVFCSFFLVFTLPYSSNFDFFLHCIFLICNEEELLSFK